MYLSKININNFRLFESLDLKLNAGLNVIVGENNSGKTALIDAIRLTLDTNSAEWTNISELDFHERTEPFHIQLKFDGITPQQASVFVEHLTHEKIDEGNRKSVLYVNLKAQVTDILKRGHRYIRIELRSGKNVGGPIIEREIRDFLSVTYLKPLRDADTELNAGRYSRLSQILSSSSEFDEKGENFKNLLETFIKASKEIVGNDGVKRDTQKIDANFKSLTFKQDADKFELAVQMLGSVEFDKMSDAKKRQAFQDILQKLSLVLDEKQPLQGLGYNNVLFMATELLLLEEEKDGFPILLIEEPEAHLHPQLQMKFLKFIRDEYSDVKKPKLQTIITTHSPNLASKAPLESIVLMKDAKVFPMRSGETGLALDDYVFLEKFLDVTKSNLFFAKGIFVVEGDAENILLPTIAECLGYSLEDYGVSIVNVGNTAYARFAKIFLRKLKEDNDVVGNWLDIPTACIRDLDLWPEKADKAINDAIGFKELKDGNHDYWLPRKDLDDNDIGTDPNTKKTKLEELSAQKVNVFVSDEWTFEYCLVKSGLDDMICEILNIPTDGLPDDEEEKAIQIYKKIETTSGAKTDVAYQLSEKLKISYDPNIKENRDALLNNLPEYIKLALKHVLSKDDLEIVDPPENENQQGLPAENIANGS